MTKKTLITFCSLIVASCPTYTNAGFLEQMDAHQKIGYAKAAVEACPTLSINSAGIHEIFKTLEAADQASVASSGLITDQSQTESSKMFELLGEASCDAALDYENKLGIDLFIEE